MQNRRFRNHISIIIEQTGGVLLALLIIFIPQFLQNIGEVVEAGRELVSGRGLLINIGMILALLAVIGIQVLIWAKTYISIEENAVIIEKNTFNKRKNTIGIRNISNINTEQNLLEMLLGTCKVKLDTNSRSTADSTDVKIVLKKADALWFQQEVARRMQAFAAAEQADGEVKPEASAVLNADLTGEGEDFDIRSDFGDILQHGLFSVNIISLLILIISTSVIVGEIVQMLEQPELMKSFLSAAAGIAVAVFIALSALWDMVKGFLRYYNFRAKRRGSKIYIRYGLFKKVEYTIPVDKIQALRIRQSFVARIGHRYMAEIVNVGMGDDQEERNSFLVLYAAEKKLEERLSVLLPEFIEAADCQVERQPASVWAAWMLPAFVYTLCVTGAAAACSFAFGAEKYFLLIWGCAAGLEILLLVCMILKYRTEGMKMDENFLKLTRGYFGKNYLAVKYENIQYVEIKQNPLARICGIGKGYLHLLASSANAEQRIPYFRKNLDDKMKSRMIKR